MNFRCYDRVPQLSDLAHFNYHMKFVRYVTDQCDAFAIPAARAESRC